MNMLYGFINFDARPSSMMEFRKRDAEERMLLERSYTTFSYHDERAVMVLLEMISGSWYEDPDTKITIAVDGAIDNVSELMRQLHPNPNLSQCWTAAETAFHIYQHSGEMGFGKLIGDFAILLRDHKKRKFLCVRDPVGIRPLYYASTGSTVSASSQIYPLLPKDKWPNCDLEYLAGYLVSGLSLTHLTPFRNVYRLLPGEMLVVENDRMRVRQYWDFSADKVERGSDEDYVNQFRQLFEESTRCRLDGRRVWSELSGGMDSSAIVCIAQRLHLQKNGKPLPTLTCTFPEANLSDERYWAQVVIDAVKSRAHIVSGDLHHPFQRIREAARYWDEPSIQMAFYGLYRHYTELMSRDDGDTLLSGIGAETAIMDKSNTPIHLADYLRRFQLLELGHQTVRWQKTLRVPFSNVFLDCCWKPLIHPNRVEYGPIRYRVPKYVNPEFARTWNLSELAMVGQRPRKFRSPADQWQYEKIYRISAFLYRGFLETVCNVRYPFLDRRILEFVMATNWDQKLRPGEMKPLLFRAMEGILPEEVRRRRINTSTGHAIYLGMRKQWTTIEEMTRRPLLAELGIVDPKKFAEALNMARTGHSEELHVLASSLALEAWLQSRSHADVRPSQKTPSVPMRVAAMR